ncbi:oxidoreductase [Prauserella marina]|uniref:3-oxoacyl-[acyl-carrier protein] reductase n=1 Tax=Prauserella marina TaxID=530584 RepID=A0A222VW03_9PSEU|nr:SDR family oxidoreductase [Prauserella marina]ASR38087.1 oxidoreductase [Prauserella marina]PWV78757.1 3-oxoacyl-[acyl-carrier protein] reductase [Prauserella marina]SDC92946.1 3-oxoacyl-[acyl-carrier protein] reductase [Prauserella marina]
MGSLNDKTALVTGGSRGIGAAIATRLAAEGARVALTYNSSPGKANAVVDRIVADGGTAIAVPAAMEDPQQVEAAVTTTVETFGGVDILVNNAGIFRYGLIDELTIADYERTMAVHARAAFAAVLAAVPHLGQGGRIISIGSNFADRALGQGISLYAMSKSALVGFTKGLARDLGPRGITAVVVHPGSTDTDMNPADSAGAEDQRALTALGHYATTDDIAATVAHLAGPAGAYITGTTITVDGGVNA